MQPIFTFIRLDRGYFSLFYVTIAKKIRIFLLFAIIDILYNVYLLSPFKYPPQKQRGNRVSFFLYFSINKKTKISG